MKKFAAIYFSRGRGTHVGRTFEAPSWAKAELTCKWRGWQLQGEIWEPQDD